MKRLPVIAHREIAVRNFVVIHTDGDNNCKSPDKNWIQASVRTITLFGKNAAGGYHSMGHALPNDSVVGENSNDPTGWTPSYLGRVADASDWSVRGTRSHEL
jgi:hypothetical protein